MEEAAEEGVGCVVVQEGPLVHQDALDVLAEGRVLTQQLHARLGQRRLRPPPRRRGGRGEENVT